MKILFLSRLVPIEYQNMYSKIAGKIMDDASIGLQERIMLGLLENNVSAKCLNVVPIFSYNKCKAFCVPSFRFSYHLDKERTIEGENIRFNNLPFLKQFSQNYHLKKTIKEVLKNDNNVTILAYSPLPAFLNGIIFAKKAYPHLNVCVIYPDLPTYMSLRKNRGFISKIYTKYNEKSEKRLEKYCEKAVFLTAHMSEIIHIPNYAVMEGIATNIELRNNNLPAQAKYIIYAGTLNERFGIIHLLSSFRLVNDPSLNIYIFGIGDSENRIKELAKNDNRIKYFGKKTKREILDYLTNSKAIINPRLPGEEFTKYSFPSKNLEALSTGVPFIAYKLPGIPNEYDTFINYPIDLSEKALADLIESVCEDTSFMYRKKAHDAKLFVLNNKNSKAMTMKIIELLKK